MAGRSASVPLESRGRSRPGTVRAASSQVSVRMAALGICFCRIRFAISTVYWPNRQGPVDSGMKITERHRHALDRLMDDHGTTILVVEIALLAVATVGAIWLDHVAGERIRRERAAREAVAAEPADGDPGAGAS